MDKLTMLNNYFSVIENTGYMSMQEVYNIIGYMFLTDLLNHPYPIMNTGEYGCIETAAKHIAQCTCLIPNTQCCDELL